MHRHHVREYTREGHRVSDYWRGRGAGKTREEESGRTSGVYERGGSSTEFTSEDREMLPDEAYVIQSPNPSEREYPVPTAEELRKYLGWDEEKARIGGERHALNALQRSTQHGTTEEKEHVRQKVAERYPPIYRSWLSTHRTGD